MTQQQNNNNDQNLENQDLGEEQKIIQDNNQEIISQLNLKIKEIEQKK